jgi:hypothetical protein
MGRNECVIDFLIISIIIRGVRIKAIIIEIVTTAADAVNAAAFQVGEHRSL